MTSDEINTALSEWGTPGLVATLRSVGAIDDGEESSPPLCPYLGFYWRSVDWDAFVVEGYSFSEPSPGLRHFDEAGKWDYPSVSATPEECQAIRAAVEKAILTRSADDIAAVQKFFQK